MLVNTFISLEISLHSCLFNKFMHLLGFSIVIISIVKMVAEVNRHDTVGDMSVQE